MPNRSRTRLSGAVGRAVGVCSFESTIVSGGAATVCSRRRLAQKRRRRWQFATLRGVKLPAVLFAIAASAVTSIAAAPEARAEDVAAYQADGDADAAAPDARVAALDEAFGKAVSQALNDVVDPEVRRQNKAVLDRELVGHARLWVQKFTVTREGVADDRKQMSVSVRVDRDKLRARLAELNIATRDAGEGPAPGAANASSVAVLLRVGSPEGVHATFGQAAEKDVSGLAALSGALRRANLVIKRAPAAGPAARPPARDDGELPLDDDAAGALGTEAKADMVAVAGVTLGAPVPLRGIAADGVLITASVKLIDLKGRKSLGQGTIVAASRGTDPAAVGYAIDHALLAAVADVLPQPAQSLAQAQAFSGEDRPVTEPGVVLVRLPRSTPWPLVQAEIRHLTGARGVTRASLRRLAPSGYVIGVATGDSIDRIAGIVKKPPTADTSATVKIVGDVIEAALAGGQ